MDWLRRITFLTYFRQDMVQEGLGSGQPRQDQCPQSLALNVTSDSSFDHGNNNKSADAAPTDQPKSRYKCKFLHLVNIKI